MVQIKTIHRWNSVVQADYSTLHWLMIVRYRCHTKQSSAGADEISKLKVRSHHLQDFVNSTGQLIANVFKMLKLTAYHKITTIKY